MNKTSTSVLMSVLARSITSVTPTTCLSASGARMVPNASDLAFRKVNVAGMRGLSLVKETDRTHLNQNGYYAWCCDIWDRAIFKLNPPQFWRDFDP